MPVSIHIDELVADGITIIPNVLTDKQCSLYKSAARDIINRLSCDNSELICDDSQQIINVFRHDQRFFNLLYTPELNEIFSYLIDDNYTLTSCTVHNRSLSGTERTRNNKPGVTWHTDSRYFRSGVKLDWGFGYNAFFLLDPVSKLNGGTQFIRGSHKDRKRPVRDGDYTYEVLTAERGSIAIMDSGLWHRVGPATEQDRFMLLNYYNPWFVKPYFQFPNMIRREFGEEFIRSLNSTQRRLLHFNSEVPIDENQARSTMIPEGLDLRFDDLPPLTGPV